MRRLRDFGGGEIALRRLTGFLDKVGENLTKAMA